MYSSIFSLRPRKLWGSPPTAQERRRREYIPDVLDMFLLIFCPFSLYSGHWNPCQNIAIWHGFLHTKYQQNLKEENPFYEQFRFWKMQHFSPPGVKFRFSPKLANLASTTTSRCLSLSMMGGPFCEVPQIL